MNPKHRRAFLKDILLLSGSVLFSSPIKSALFQSKRVIGLSMDDLENARLAFYKKEYTKAEELCKELIGCKSNNIAAYSLLRRIYKAQNKDYKILELFYNAQNGSVSSWIIEQYQKVLQNTYFGNTKDYNRFLSNYKLSISSVTEKAPKSVNLKSGDNRNKIRIGDYLNEFSDQTIEKICTGFSDVERRQLFFEKEQDERIYNLTKRKKQYLLLVYKRKLDKKNYSEALRILRKTFEEDTSDKNLFCLLRNELIRQSQIKEAVSLYRNYPVNQNDFWARIGYAKTLRLYFETTGTASVGEHALNEYTNILKDFTGEISFQDYLTAQNGIGICLRLQEQYEKAYAHYTSVIKEANDSDDVLSLDELIIGKSRVLFQMGSVDKAKALVYNSFPANFSLNRDDSKYSSLECFFIKYFTK